MSWMHPSRRAQIIVACCTVLIITLTFGIWQVPDLRYVIEECMPGSFFRSYDALIFATSQKHGISPELIKAVVWQESRFNARSIGAAGERGLMQVTENAAKDWVAAQGVEVFVPTDLFDPKTNLDVGTWLLARALKRYAEHDDPRPFALAEYNAGKSRVNRWKGESGGQPTAEEFRASIDFPSTAAYIVNILSREEFYRRRREFSQWTKPSAACGE